MTCCGVLILDKPDGPTSHDCVNIVRRLYNTRRIGHTGTLDPFATGVLVMLVGKATRLARFFNEDDKCYEAAVVWGSATDTGDRTGAIVDSTPEPMPKASDIEKAMESMTGKIEQIPPMYSAVKVNGKPLYKMARKGKVVERKAKAVRIHELRLMGCGESEFKIFVRCSKGAYIRTLAEDLAKKLGGFAHLKDLRRTASGSFRVDSAHKLGDIKNAGEDLNHFLIPMSQALENYPVLSAGEALAREIEHGKQPAVEELSGEEPKPGSIVRIVEKNGGELLAMGSVGERDGKITLLMVLAAPDENLLAGGK